MEHHNKSFFEKFRIWFRKSLFIKTSSIFFIMLILMIPSLLVKDLIRERRMLKESVVREVSNKWGESQKIIGPVLTVPYIQRILNDKGIETSITRYANFLPERLKIEGQVNPITRSRGIYEAILYQSNLAFSGLFADIDPQELGINASDVYWNNAFLVVSIPDMAGINDNIIMTWDDVSKRMSPGINSMNGINAGVQLPIELDPGRNHTFKFSIDLNGSSSLTFAPVGKETNVNIKSSWPSPSFSGSFLPDHHEVTNEGFSAQWKVLDLNRNYPQQWVGKDQRLDVSDFGFNLIQPVNGYSKNMRCAKYALLIISLTFLVFFFFEILSKSRIHPMHYILVGLALIIFYILLLSLSEHIGFNMAYLFSGISTISLIVFYSQAILRNKTLTLILSGILLSIFGFVYIILQLEDYALLAGSLGLFAVLATVMVLSRGIDWSNLSNGKVSTIGNWTD